ncbi:MAG TPA: M6 family metalloprotease domain-containing protein [Actinomycetota bacterium]|nr:M6 family metalloprotease domain-containing protein [Actinomycetota bacterium]
MRSRWTLLVVLALFVPATAIVAVGAPASASSGTLASSPSDAPGFSLHPGDIPSGAERAAFHVPYGRSARGLASTDSKNAAFSGGSPGDGPVSGTAFIPVILADFSDEGASKKQHPPRAYKRLLFEKDYPHGAGSLRDYYDDQSSGLLDVTGVVTDRWLRMPRTYKAYSGSSEGYQNSVPNDRTLVEDAVERADSSMDFCKGDTDRDGYVDTVFVVHAGPGAEEVGSGIWSIHWFLSQAYETDDVCANGRAARVSDFTVVPEGYARSLYSAPGAPDKLISIGIFAHEFGHVLGLPDLYDTDGSSPGGVGPWDLMATGTFGFTGEHPWRPMPLSPWSKMHLGWAQPLVAKKDLRRSSLGSLDLRGSGGKPELYKVPSGGPSTLYYLIENRQRSVWSADMPAEGIAIWRIDESASDNDGSRRMVHLVQADGLNELGASQDEYEKGDAGDLWPGVTGKRKFAPGTTPSSALAPGSAIGITVRIRSLGALSGLDIILADVPQTIPRPAPFPTPTPTATSNATAHPTGTPTPWASPTSWTYPTPTPQPSNPQGPPPSTPPAQPSPEASSPPAPEPTNSPPPESSSPPPPGPTYPPN